MRLPSVSLVTPTARPRSASLDSKTSRSFGTDWDDWIDPFSGLLRDTVNSTSRWLRGLCFGSPQFPENFSKCLRGHANVQDVSAIIALNEVGVFRKGRS